MLSAEEQIFSEHEQMLFTKAVSVAESFGKTYLAAGGSGRRYFCRAGAERNSLEAAAVVSGLSTKLTRRSRPTTWARRGRRCRSRSASSRSMSSNLDGEAKVFHIGPHAPALSPTMCNWSIGCGSTCGAIRQLQDLHHSDIITYALTRLAGQYAREKQEVLRDLRNCRAANSVENALPAPSSGIRPNTHRTIQNLYAPPLTHGVF